MSQTDTTQDTEVITIDGVDCVLVPAEYSFPTLQIPESHLGDIQEFSLLAALDSRGSYYIFLNLVDEQGTVLASTFTANLDSLKEGYRLYIRDRARKATAEELINRLCNSQEKLPRLENGGRPTSYLRNLIARARRSCESCQYRFFGVSIDQALSAIRAVESEIERLEGDLAEVIADDLLAGRVRSDVANFNMAAIAEINARSIRTGGFIEPFTLEQLRQFYLEQLQGITFYTRLREHHVHLNVEDYAPQEFLDSGEITVAPAAISLESRKGSSNYPVRYEHVVADGSSMPVGIVTVPLSVYERNAAEYGKTSKFEEVPMPHGITLLIEIVADNKVIARGTYGEELQKKIKKYKGAKQRGQNKPVLTALGEFMCGEVPADPAPKRSKGQRGRRL